MNVKNLNGSSRFPKPSCGCSSWIDHWDNNSGCKRPNKCPGCQKPLTRNNTVGAHVIKVNSPDKDRYITPLCDECNHKKDIVFDISESHLVKVNERKCSDKLLQEAFRNFFVA